MNHNAEIDALRQAVAAATALGDSWVGFDDSHHYGDALLKALGPTVVALRVFTADEVIEIANETSDSFGNLYRLDFIDRIRHEARDIPPGQPDYGYAADDGNWYATGDIPHRETEATTGDDCDDFHQCPHEVIRATCGRGGCTCPCDPCAPSRATTGGEQG